MNISLFSVKKAFFTSKELSLRDSEEEVFFLLKPPPPTLLSLCIF